MPRTSVRFPEQPKGLTTSSQSSPRTSVLGFGQAHGLAPPLALSPKRTILVQKSPGNMAKEKKITTVNNDGHIVALENALIRQDEHIILRDVNFQVRPGEFLYLIGRVGSGKSSLLKTLYAEIPLREGTGFAAGYQLNKLKTKEVPGLDRKSTRLNSSHVRISYAVFCLKKK